MIRKEKIDELKGDKRTNVLFIYESIDDAHPDDLILVALRYGTDKHWLLKPRIVGHNEHQIIIKDGNRRYVVELLFNRV